MANWNGHGRKHGNEGGKGDRRGGQKRKDCRHVLLFRSSVGLISPTACDLDTSCWQAALAALPACQCLSLSDRKLASVYSRETNPIPSGPNFGSIFFSQKLLSAELKRTFAAVANCGNSALKSLLDIPLD